MTQGTFGYTYDNNGNITEIRKNNSLIAKYTYDEMNQLVREDNYLLNKTYIFAYDTAGNILSKKTYNTVLATESGTPDATTVYTYATSDWKDQLISVGGDTIVYDVLGNPTTYRGHSLTWGKLRQLNSFDNNTFTYNAKGIRTSKNSITYTLDGTKILSETRPTGTIKYLYGASGVIGFTYNNNTYYYEKNIQGDVTAIVNASGTIKAKYTYDAWGNHTITLDTDGIGTLNAIRYRSYYYDVETGLYYLQSRYYDPTTCRFINADSIIDAGGILGYNMFAYCSNNPVMEYDPTGMIPAKPEIIDNDPKESISNCGAIYYVDYDFLKKAGHASLFYKYDGKWYMIQLKSCDEDYGIALEVIVATLSAVLSQLNDSAIPLETFAIEQRECIGDFNDVMDRIHDTKNRYEIAFLPGDFSAIHTDNTPTDEGEKITSIHRYNLLQYNCNHYIRKHLKKCNNAGLMKNFGNRIMPSNTFKRLKKYYLTEPR